MILVGDEEEPDCPTKNGQAGDEKQHVHSSIVQSGSERKDLLAAA